MGAWDYDAHFDIFTARRDGTGIKRLTEADGYDAEGAYSPDGARSCSARCGTLIPRTSCRAETGALRQGSLVLRRDLHHDADGSASSV